jgi:transcription antitermination factor NusG
MELNWYALAVKSRHEFVARDELVHKGITTFLPSILKLRQWRDRKKQIEFPLFPGYLFVYLAACAEEFVRALKARGSVSLISLEPGRPTPVKPEEIEALKAVIACGRSFDVYPHFQPGTKVRLCKGPLAGTEGVLARREDHHLFCVNVEILGRSVGLRVNADDIEQR